jgi:hypothetical protein
MKLVYVRDKAARVRAPMPMSERPGMLGSPP